MFGIGFTEILLVAIIGLIFIGPEELPKVARNLGRFLNEMRRGSDQFMDEIKKSSPVEDLNKISSDIDTSLHQRPKTLEDSPTAEQNKKDLPE